MVKKEQKNREVGIFISLDKSVNYLIIPHELKKQICLFDK